MAKRYIIWVDVEEHDTETDEYRNLDSNSAPGPSFSSEGAAEDFVKDLVTKAREMASTHAERYLGDPKV